MQTFLPYSNLSRTASVLDRQRLGKQRVETLQIVKALTDPSYGWQNHPVVGMWRGYLPALLKYQMAICGEWTRRGYKDTCLDKTFAIARESFGSDYEMKLAIVTAIEPPWFGNADIHLSHRSNLLRKLPEHYAPLFEPELVDTIPYVWPKNIGIVA